MTAAIREVTGDDIDALAARFADWPKDRKLFVRYVERAAAGEIDIVGAFVGDEPAGYLTISWRSGYAPFAEAGIPEIVDLNVLSQRRRRGIASALLTEAERRIAERGPVAGIRVGLHSGYGSAQRLYVLRGYVPDAAGTLIAGVAPPEGAAILLDDEPELALTRRLDLPDPEAPRAAGSSIGTTVVTRSLELLAPPPQAPRQLPTGVRLERATGVTPEYARFLYGLVGGPWRWIDRLGWTRGQWAEELAVPGDEVWVASADGVPAGYVQLHPDADRSGSVEIRYFGIVEGAIGRGLGGALLEHGIAAAWTLGDRHALAPTDRVWVHTCSLDGPAALANYLARGFVEFRVEETIEQVPEAPLGSWISTGGPA